MACCAKAASFPARPLSPIVTICLVCATSMARSTLGELPLVLRAECNVSGGAEAGERAGKDFIVPIVVADGGDRGTIGAEREAGQAAAFEKKASGKFGGKMLCVGGAAAIAKEQDFVAGAQGVSHGLGRAGYGREVGVVFQQRGRQVHVIGDAGGDKGTMRGRHESSRRS